MNSSTSSAAVATSPRPALSSPPAHDAERAHHLDVPLLDAVDDRKLELRDLQNYRLPRPGA